MGFGEPAPASKQLTGRHEDMTKDLMVEVQKIDLSFSAFKNLEGFGELLQLLKGFWVEQDDVRKNFDRESVLFVYESLLRELVNSVLRQPDPEMALRGKLVDVSYTLGCYISLMFPPEPAADPTRMRNPKIGTTGTLRPYALELVKAYEGIPGHELINAEASTLGMVDDYILFECLYWMATFNTLSKMRKVLDKVSSPRAWESMALEVSCSMWEQTHREAIGLPYPLEADITDRLYRRHSNLLQIIRSGAPDPLAAWQASVARKEATPAVP